MANHFPTWPVSVKGVAADASGHVVLLLNERDEWELPGGRLEPSDDSPESAVVREVQEETGWRVEAGPLLDTWIYQPLPETLPDRRVLIVTYGCTLSTTDTAPIVSQEHSQVGLFTAEQIRGLRMPNGYKRSIAAWLALL